ncbi:hypothetical protein DITRI_Ditri02bG0053300 [Diplodiscus trichospermus]
MDEEKALMDEEEQIEEDMDEMEVEQQPPLLDIQIPSLIVTDLAMNIALTISLMLNLIDLDVKAFYNGLFNLFSFAFQVMESLECETKIGAPIIAEFLGGAINCDAHYINDPRADGLGVFLFIKRCLEDCGVSPKEVILSFFDKRLFFLYSSILLLYDRNNDSNLIHQFMLFLIFTSLSTSFLCESKMVLRVETH